jgi:hypothetical protein
MFYDTARRVRNPDARWENSGPGAALVPADRAGMGWVLVDGVDALTAIWDAVAPPRATSLLNGARTILGHVMRDPAPLRSTLNADGVRGEVRRALVIALALLGEPVPLEEAVPESEDESDTASFILARVLCCSEKE